MKEEKDRKHQEAINAQMQSLWDQQLRKIKGGNIHISEDLSNEIKIRNLKR
jgi:hypothetical protein